MAIGNGTSVPLANAAIALEVSHTYSSGTSCALGCYGLISSPTLSNASSQSFLAAYSARPSYSDSATLASAIGFWSRSTTNTGGGTITDNFGIYVDAQTVGTSDYGIAVSAADTQTLWLSNNDNNTVASAGIAFGSSRDTNLYRSAADTLRTDDALYIGSNLTLVGNLIPSAADVIDLGSATAEIDEIYLGDDGGVVLGLDQDATLGYDEAGDDRVELTGTGASLFIEDRLSLGVDTKNLSDDGVANDSHTPTSSYTKVSIDETGDVSVPDLVLTESSAKEGDILVIVNDENDGSHDTFTITNSAGLVQLPVGTLTLGPNDSITLIYTDDRWVTLSVSDNL